LRLSERRATNIGLLYPKVRNNIGRDIPVDVPPQLKYWGDVSPASPAALTPVLSTGLYLDLVLNSFSPRPFVYVCVSLNITCGVSLVPVLVHCLRLASSSRDLLT